MKTNSPKALFFLLFTVTLFACKKEGPAGPQGEQGQQGVPGPQGPQGKVGAADVIVYTFPSTTFMGMADFPLKDLSKGKMDSSIVLAYFNTGSLENPSWYPIPGPGPAATYETRYALYRSGIAPNLFWVLSVRATKTNDLTVQHPNLITFTSTKVFIVPAAKMIAGGKKAMPDLNNYNEVVEYFGIKD